MSLQIVNVRDDLLSKISVETLANATTGQLQDVLIAINGALQLLNMAGEDYITRKTITVNTVNGTQKYALPASTQAVLGPVRMGTTALKALTSRGQVDQFDRIFMGGSTYGAAAGIPVAYFVEFINNAAAAGDTTTVNLYLCPTPNLVTAVDLEVVTLALTIADLTLTTILPVPQNYTESLFLPIARMMVSRSSTFSRPDIRDQLEADGQAALATLGLAGGFPNVRPPKPDREVAA